MNTREIGIRELNQQTSKVLAEVKAGSVVVLKERGAPIATIVPIKADRYQQMVEVGQILPAKNPSLPLPAPQKLPVSSAEILADRDEL